MAIKDVLNDKLDWETFKPVTASHIYKTIVTNGNYVEFVFDNINLPAQQVDEEGSNGFIAFKIKPRNTVVLNDIILGKADIFFDFNSPIITNTVSTQFTTELSVIDLNQTTISVYPIPSNGKIYVELSNTIKINKAEVFSANGSLLIDKKQGFDFIDISNLSKGVYFLKLSTYERVFVKKIIKN